MKKTKFTVLILFQLLMGITAQSLNAQTNLQIPSTDIAPVIDGTIDAVWGNSQSTDVENVLVGTATTSADYSASFKTLWNALALYVLVVVTDDAKINDSGSIWNDDAVEIYVDIDNNKLTSFGSNDYQYTFRWNDPAVYSNNGGTSGVEFNISGTSYGYILEIKLPWATMGLSSPRQNVLMGFDVQIHDDDDGGDRDNKFGWFATTDDSWYNPSLLATAKLVGEITTLYAAEKPKISVDRGFYKNPFDVTISTTISGMNIYYTLDGSDPSDTTKAIIAASPVVVHIDPENSANRGITPGVVLRARAKKTGYDFSLPETRTYLFIDKIGLQTTFPGHDWPTGDINGQATDLLIDNRILVDSRYSSLISKALTEVPSISISTDLDNLYNPTTGIYVNALNRGTSWERPASIELINPDGSDGFQIDAGLRIRGGYSRNDQFRKHAFRLFFRKEYGEGKLDFPLFEEEGVDSYDKVDLRCPQNYSWSKGGSEAPYCTFTRDIFSRDLQRAMNEPYTRSRYYHLYIDGLYWGIYQTQERSEARFAASYLGGETSDYDVVKKSDSGSIEATDGTLDAWRSIWDICEQGLSGNTNYYKLQGLDANGLRDPSLKVLVDIDNLIDYMNVIFFTGNFDAPASAWINNNKGCNNFYAVYNRNDEKGFMFFAHDNEHTLLYDPMSPGIGVNENRVNIGNLTNEWQMVVTDFSQFHPQWLHFKLTQNAEYRQRFTDRAYKYYYNNGVCTPSQTTKLFLARTYEIDTAIIAESARWGDVDSWVLRTKEDWTWAINQVINQYFPVRTNIVIAQLQDAGLLSTINAPVFKSNNAEITDTKIELSAGNTLSILNPGTSGSIKYTIDGSDPRLVGGNVSSTAVDGANQTNISILQTCIVKARIFNNGNWSALHTINVNIDNEINGIQITEIHYNPLSQDGISGSEYEFLELKNRGASPVNLTSSTFIDGIKYTFTSETTINPGSFIVLASSAYSFKQRYGFSPNGEYDGQLDNKGEQITLVSAVGDTIVTVKYGDSDPWPTTPDSLGFSLVPAVSDLNSDWNDGTNWRASAAIGGSPNADDEVVNLSEIYINEILSNSEPPQVDAIELFNPNGAAVDIGGWYLSDNRDHPKKWKIPAGTFIPANGYKVFYEGHYVDNTMVYNNNEFGDSLSLSSHGEEVYIFSASSSGELTGYEHGFDFGEIESGVTFGRYINSVDKEHFVAQAVPTLGQQNGYPRVGPLVINQIMFNPQSDQYEYLELINTSTDELNLFEITSKDPWKVDGIGFTFPMNITLTSGESVYLVESSITPADFRTLNNLDNSVKVYNFSGALKNEGEEITLFKAAPQYTEDNEVKTPYIRIDKVDYNDNDNWADADGNGYALQRTSLSLYGNDPANWVATPPGIKIKTISLPEAIEGNSYSKELIASGGTTPYTWTTTSGNLPLGISLNPVTGYIEGIPTHTGNFSFTIKVEDVSGGSDEISLSLYVKANNPPVALDDTINTIENYTVIASILNNDIDLDGDIATWTVSLSVDPVNGAASVNYDKTITYVPVKGFVGADKLTYRVTDAKGYAEAILVINVQQEVITASIESKISVSTDDMEENVTSHTLFDTSSDIELTYDSNPGGDQIVGLRFLNIQIPEDATVTNAYIQFKTDEVGSTTTSLIIHGEATLNPVTFSLTDLVSSRLTTPTVVSWIPESWDSEGEISEKQRTPDLSSIVNEIIGLDGWSTGNAMSFIITGTGTRIAEAYEGDAAGAALLHIEYRINVTEAAIPVASAGTAQNIYRGNTVQLNGSNSNSSDGRSLNYHWTLVSKPLESSAILSNQNIVNPTFVADKYGQYTASLMVDNGINESETSTVVITVENHAPVANAGTDQSHLTGSLIRLNGSSSYDPDGDAITYLWEWVSKPTASTASISDATISGPSFTADLTGTYSLSLTLNDGLIGGNTDVVVITVSSNQPPVANAGKDQNVITGTVVSLDGTKSTDPEDDNLTYNWTITSKPAGSSAALSSASANKPTIQPDVAGTYIISLVVSDGTNNSSVDEVAITSTDDLAPVAIAGDDLTVYTQQQVTLDGSDSYDPEGKTLSFQWYLVTRPAGSQASLVSNSTATPSFTADVSGLYAFRLKVSDGNNTSEDQVQITALPGTAVYTTDIFASLKAYPNPFIDKLVVDYYSPQYQKIEFSLCNISGVVIKKFEFESKDNCSKILNLDDVSLPRGMYLLIMKSEKGDPRAIKINHYEK